MAANPQPGATSLAGNDLASWLHWGLRAGVAALLCGLLATAAHAEPANLVASPGDGRATLSWDEPQAAVNGYELRHGHDRDALGEWIAIGADAAQHTVPGLTNGRRHYFELRATGSDWSVGASVALAAVPDASVDIPDDHLRTMLTRALGIDAGAEITQGQMATLTVFTAQGNDLVRSSPWRESIVDLKGVEFAVNATEMHLELNNISDLAPLANLTALTHLQLSGNEIADVAPLGELTSLRILSLARNRISDISPLAKLKSLRKLLLSGNAIANISPLAEMTSLGVLDLSGNRVADLSPLKDSGTLVVLYLDKNRITNISALAKLPLHVLWLDKNKIADISPLAELTYLQSLGLGSAGISDISPLAKLRRLESLYLDHNQITDISPLAEFTSLRNLNLSGNLISDITPLAEKTALFSLNLSDNGLTDISPLADLVEVRYLFLHNNEIADISPLTRLPLAWLDIHNNRIEDASPLAGLTALDDLNLSGNRIADIAPLRELTALTRLDLGGNRIADVAPLAGVTKLWRLALDHNEIADISSLGGWSNMNRLYLNHNAIVDVSALAGAVYGAHVDLRGNPLGRAAVQTQVPALRTSAGVLFDDGAHRVPFFPSNGFVRVINHSDEAGEVSILGIDEAGRRRGPRTLALAPKAAIHFDAADWRWGNSAKGLTGVGAGHEGDWRLTLTSPLDVEVLGYVRAPDGLLTSMHDLAPEAFTTHHVWMFNPGGNQRQVSRLRLVNPTNVNMTALVYGRDDAVAYDANFERRVGIALPAHQTREFTAAQLESGDAEGIVGGGLGDGNGKWWLSVDAPSARVMSLLESPSGHLANISAPIVKWPQRQATLTTFAAQRENYLPEPPRAQLHRIPLFPSAAGQRHGFLRIVALANRQPTLALRAFDGSGREVAPAALRVPRRGSMHFNSHHLETGNAAKGLPGTGATAGDWHLELRANDLFHVLGYGRTLGGFVSGLHHVAPRAADGSLWVPFFHAAGDEPAQTTLRLVNWRDAPAEVTVSGVDDAGRSPGGTVRMTIPARAAANLSAEQLESGRADGLSGALGDGEGSWRLRVEAPDEVDAMSLLQLPTGELVNLSTTPRYPRP